MDNSILKWTESGHWWLQHFPFSLKINITTISFYWRNDIPTFCHLTDLIPKSVCPWDFYSFALFVRIRSSYILLVYFFKGVISFIGSLDKYATSAFSMLWLLAQIRFNCKMNKQFSYNLEWKQRQYWSDISSLIMIYNVHERNMHLDLDLHCSQKLLVSSSVMKELI